MTKKLIAVLTALLIFTVLLTGCGENGANSGNRTSTPESTPTSTEIVPTEPEETIEQSQTTTIPEEFWNDGKTEYDLKEYCESLGWVRDVILTEEFIRDNPDAMSNPEMNYYLFMTHEVKTDMHCRFALETTNVYGLIVDYTYAPYTPAEIEWVPWGPTVGYNVSRWRVYNCEFNRNTRNPDIKITGIYGLTVSENELAYTISVIKDAISSDDSFNPMVGKGELFPDGATLSSYDSANQ
jgi:hypothetical protein